MAAIDTLRNGLQQVERDAQLLLDTKRELVNSDRERNALREASRELKKLGKDSPCGLWSPQRSADKVWVMQPGGVAIRMDQQRAAELIESRQSLAEAVTAQLRQRQKEIALRLSDKGGVTATGNGLLKAMVNLKDNV